MAMWRPDEDGAEPADRRRMRCCAPSKFGEMESYERLSTVTHVFTHYKLHIAPYRITLARRPAGRRIQPRLATRWHSWATPPCPRR
jgi:adenine-specific DNA glycosylase